MREPLVRDLFAFYLQAKLQFQVSASSCFGAEAIPLCKLFGPTALLLQHPSDVDTAETIALANRLQPPVPVVLIHRQDARASSLPQGGAAAGVAEVDDLPRLEHVLHHLLDGRALPPAEKPVLTARQSEVLRMILHGLSTREIAAALGISYKTADHHRVRLMRRLGAHSVVELIQKARQRGLAA